MTIVCATDFSEPAGDAMRVAEVIAKKRNEPLLLWHAVATQPVDPVALYVSSMRADAVERLEKEAERIAHEGITVTTEVVMGAPDQQLPQRMPADTSLIVVGARGHTPGTHWLIGSVAERLARVTTVPMLVVRDAARLHRWLGRMKALEVVVATDLTAVSDFALRRTSLLQELGPCDLELLYIEYPPAEYARLGVTGPVCVHHAQPLIDDVLSRELARRAESVRSTGSVRTRIARTLGSTGQLIALEAVDADADLVVVGAHQAPSVTRLWHESVAHGVLHSADTNVLLIPFHTADEAVRALEPAPLTTIVAATDFSPCGNHAVASACAMAGPASHVIITSVARSQSEAEACSRQLDLVKSAVQNGHRIDTIVTVGKDVAASICATAERVSADVVVVGRHTRSRVGHVLSGSVSGEVLARSRRPVLIVPDPATM